MLASQSQGASVKVATKILFAVILSGAKDPTIEAWVNDWNKNV